MFYDWLTIEQDFGYQLPILGDVAYQRIHLETGEGSSLSQPVFQHKGSFCDMVFVSVRGSVLKVKGNPSRWGRVENLFGLPTVDACVSVFNSILVSLGGRIGDEITDAHCRITGYERSFPYTDKQTGEQSKGYNVDMLLELLE
ncbi:hypothetical protein HX37_25820 [Salmonella enterica]|uniref:Uncharacterized protein n=1 Tax=Salmonella enterica TaxID=28901 RepID=A0A5U2F626_SALER|nr:hypothetical protein [Salmonella enterica]